MGDVCLTTTINSYFSARMDRLCATQLINFVFCKYFYCSCNASDNFFLFYQFANRCCVSANHFCALIPNGFVVYNNICCVVCEMFERDFDRWRMVFLDEHNFFWDFFLGFILVQLGICCCCCCCFPCSMLPNQFSTFLDEPIGVFFFFFFFFCLFCCFFCCFWVLATICTQMSHDVLYRISVRCLYASRVRTGNWMKLK